MRPTALAALAATVAIALTQWGIEARSVGATQPPTLSAPPVSDAPPTKLIDVVDAYGTTVVHDPYRWLENAKSPDVASWIDAQNAYADRVFGMYPASVKAIATRVRELSITSTGRRSPHLAGSTLFYLRQTPPQEQAVLVAQHFPGGRERVLFDPNGAGGATAITEFWPSPNGRYVAYGTAERGTEDTIIGVIETATRRILPDRLVRAGGGTTPPAVAWDPDDRGLTYARLPLRGSVPETELGFSIALFHHRLGAPTASDQPEFGRGLSRVAEYQLLSSADGRRVAALVHAGDGEPDAVYVRDSGRWRLVLPASAGVRDGAFAGERLLVVATSVTQRGRIVAIEAAGTARTLVPEGAWAMEAVAPVAGGFLVTELWGPDWRVRQFTNEGKLVRTLALPASGITVDPIASESGSPVAIVPISGWAEPGRWVQYDARSGALAKVFSVKPPADYSKVTVTRIDAVSKGGARVPVSVLSMRGTSRDGKAPTILTAYGAYGLSVSPRFIGFILAWLERGGVFAVANIRGGGEFGEAWHEDGRLLRKQHDYDDFAAAAQALISGGWTSPAKLGIVGGSNGGLLMGAALTQHPELYRAVVGFAGIYDMLRVELHPNGAFNVTEFGTVKNAAQFRALYAYSPFHHVSDGVAYPSVLLVTGENDPRVDPMQSRKMAARLQMATGSGHPVALITRRAAGHGVGASFSQRVGNNAAEMVFFAGELGAFMTAPGRSLHENLENLARRYYAFGWSHDPVWATDLGLHTADGQLADFSPQALAAYSKGLRGFRNELAALAPQAGAPVHDQIDYLLLRSDMEGDWWRRAVLKSLSRNPALYEQECSNGIFSLLKKPFASNDVRAKAAASRMRQCRRVLEQGRAALTDAVREFGAVASEDIASAKPLFTTSLDALTAGISSSRKSELYAARDDALAALADYKGWVDAHMSSWHAGGFAVGKEQYDWYLRRVLLLPWNSERLLSLSQDELARDRGLEAWEGNHGTYATGPPHSQPPFTDKQSFLRFYESQTARVQTFVAAHHLVTLPPYLGRFRIVELPAAFAATFPGGFMNAPGTFDKDHTGFYFVPNYDPKNTSFFAAQARRAVLPVLAHEGIPGHFLQLSIAARNPDFVRRMHGDGVLNEGWAFYGEEMLMRAGLYDGDPAAREEVIHLMRHRATRIAVDVGLASGRMTLPQAIDFFAVTAGIDHATAKGEGTRFAMGPGQAIDYLTGKTQIQELLGVARDREGTAFSLGAFHDRLLSFGSLPLSAIAWEWLNKRDWIDAVREPIAPVDMP